MWLESSRWARGAAVAVLSSSRVMNHWEKGKLLVSEHYGAALLAPDHDLEEEVGLVSARRVDSPTRR